MVWGLIELYEATFEISYLEAAIGLNREMVDIFWDKKGGGPLFYGRGERGPHYEEQRDLRRGPSFR